ncbi:UDP-3-O-(3-hydroxymyristoyl)glucosamine N-acyltransferase [Atrimonas thermophila]|uniref:UDP-3-O-(3-hydroxymyristoyl)glucosamine N-acyltransferase n=1 Tax=Atrimonas thermophila TaxID=3064161 RepID=UPI00399D19DE
MKLKEVATLLGGVTVVGDPDFEITGLNTPAQAEPGELVFLFREEFLEEVRSSRSRVLVVEERFVTEFPDRNLLVVTHPRLAFAKIASLFSPREEREGVHPSAFVHPEASLGEGVWVGPFAVVEKGAQVGAQTKIFPQVYIGERVRIGSDCLIYPGVVIGADCEIGNRVILHPGVVIGGDGFGYEWDGEKHLKIPHLGRVVIEDEVEIGSNSTVDRATLGETRIGQGTKIDNLVMIAHNVQIGEKVLIAAQSGIAGSSVVEDLAVLGGQSGVVDHTRVRRATKVAARGGVVSEVGPDAVVSGFPAQEHHREMRQQALIRKLPELFQRIRKLEKAVFRKQ